MKWHDVNVAEPGVVRLLVSSLPVYVHSILRVCFVVFGSLTLWHVSFRGPTRVLHGARARDRRAAGVVVFSAALRWTWVVAKKNRKPAGMLENAPRRKC